MIGLLRVKNEARWIERALLSLQPLCDRMLVMDDHSTDETPELARQCGAEVLPSPFEGLDEARDKDWLLQHAGNSGWAMMIDGDEELYAPDVEMVRAACADPGAAAYSLRVLYLWNSPTHVRVDGVYGRFRRPSLFRLGAGLSFRRTGAGATANFHCSNVPEQLVARVRPCGARLLHYGYMLSEDRMRKYEWYTARDGANRAEDGYRHVVIGDVFPAESRFMHAGPLELARLG